MPIKFYLSILFLLLVQLIRSELHILGEDGRVHTEELIVSLDDGLEFVLVLLDLGFVLGDAFSIVPVIDGETEVGLGEANGVHRIADIFKGRGDGLGSVISPIVEAEELSDGMIADDFVVHMICWL